MHVRSSRVSAFLLAILVVVAGTTRTGTQHADMAAGGAAASVQAYFQPIAIYKTALGPFTWPISSKAPEAQAYFDQGVQLRYSLGKIDAVRSFREAWRRDPTCAICYWGEAWAWGQNLNAPVRPAEMPYAFAAIQQAVKLKASATAREAALIDAMATRYSPTYDEKKLTDLQIAYAAAMERVVAQFPSDLNARTLYGEALFLQLPRAGARDANDPAVRRIMAAFETVLAADIRHPGACHLYIHVTEATTVAEKGAPCAQFLGKSVPGASHMVHMPSHTWTQIGRWGDAVRSSLDAWHTDQRAATGQAFAIYSEHNLHMLLYAASMDGQGKVAVQAGKDFATLVGDTTFQLLAMIRFGRFNDIRGFTTRPRLQPYAGVWDFAQAYTELRLGNPPQAQALADRLATMTNVAATTSVPAYRGQSTAAFLGVLNGILQGELLRGSNPAGAIAAFQRAVTAQDSFIWDEPEPLPFPARDWLGAALIDQKRFAEAEAVYQKDLEKHPHNGWALFGLQQALAGQGKSTADVAKQFQTAWIRADVKLTATRY